MYKIWEMFQTYVEILEILDPEAILFQGFDRESSQITKKIDELQDYINGFLDKSSIKPSAFTDINLISQIINKCNDDYCEICLMPQGKEITREAKGKKGHLKCINYLLNRVLLE